ncbi:MAG TPA: hypothetical protein VHX13_03075 [Acidobacteriaceae bacterium]|jgi:hypothetical protein|nr:hypothetical protein [Acidobacteriaceae bacterium]
MPPATGDPNPQRAEVDRFILSEIDSVPHLEALLLLWNSRPKQWPVEELASFLYIPVDRTREILQDLQQRELAVMTFSGCFYNPNFGRDNLMEELDRTYRRELVRVSNTIHSKASPAVREFARAFRLKKDKP